MVTATKAFQYYKLRWCKTVKASVFLKSLKEFLVINGIIHLAIAFVTFMAIIKITEILKKSNTGKETFIKLISSVYLSVWTCKCMMNVCRNSTLCILLKELSLAEKLASNVINERNCNSYMLGLSLCYAEPLLKTKAFSSLKVTITFTEKSKTELTIDHHLSH